MKKKTKNRLIVAGLGIMLFILSLLLHSVFILPGLVRSVEEEAESFIK